MVRNCGDPMRISPSILHAVLSQNDNPRQPRRLARSWRGRYWPASWHLPSAQAHDLDVVFVAVAALVTRVKPVPSSAGHKQILR